MAGDLAVTQEQRGDEELIVARDRGTGDAVWSHGNPCGSVNGRAATGRGPRRPSPTARSSRTARRAFSTAWTPPPASCCGRMTRLRKAARATSTGASSASPLVIESLGLVVISLGTGGAGRHPSGLRHGQRRAEMGRRLGQGQLLLAALATLCGRPLIVSVNDKTVTGHDPADGKVLWEYRWRPPRPRRRSRRCCPATGYY